MMLILICGVVFGAAVCFVVDYIRGPWSEVLTNYLLTLMFVVTVLGIFSETCK